MIIKIYLFLEIVDLSGLRHSSLYVLVGQCTERVRHSKRAKRGLYAVLRGLWRIPACARTLSPRS